MTARGAWATAGAGACCTVPHAESKPSSTAGATFFDSGRRKPSQHHHVCSRWVKRVGFRADEAIVRTARSTDAGGRSDVKAAVDRLDDAADDRDPGAIKRGDDALRTGQLTEVRAKQWDVLYSHVTGATVQADPSMRSLPFGRVLAIGAHCDDIEIGCGGTLHRLGQQGVPIFGLYVTDTHYQRNGVVLRDKETARKEARRAAEIIGYEPVFGAHRNNGIILDENLVYLIRGQIEAHAIDTVFTHWIDDAHLDHARVARATLMATRDTKNLLMYRSNRFKSTSHFSSNLSIDISESWDAKLQALKCYESELVRVGEGFLEFVESLNTHEGIALGTRFAEPFSCMKALL